jgi:hypothetical protein
LLAGNLLLKGYLSEKEFLENTSWPLLKENERRENFPPFASEKEGLPKFAESLTNCPPLVWVVPPAAKRGVTKIIDIKTANNNLFILLPPYDFIISQGVKNPKLFL